MEKLVALTIMSLAIKHLVESFKPLYTEKKWNISLIASTILGIAVAFTTQVDFLKLVGFETNNAIVGMVITGLGLSGGSNTIFDFVNRKKEEGNESNG